MSPEVTNGGQPSEDWPNKEFLETALRKWLEDPKLRVTEFTSRIATNKGDNYTSDMFRVTAKCEGKKDPLTIVIKRIISTGGAANMLVQSSMSIREEQMLDTVLPEMYTVLKKVVPDAEPFGAGFVYSTPGVLAMEDLQPGGFRMAQRLLGLDLNHCSLVLRTLARFHAASVYIMERKSLDLSVYRPSIFSEPHGQAEMEVFYNGMLNTLSEELKTMEGLEKYSAKVAAVADENMLSLLDKDVAGYEDGDFIVVSHGDLWVNNILFRYSPSGVPDGVRFVDFQTTTITSPCVDLQYFLTTSANETVRTTCLDQLFEVYHESLCKTMAALECSTRPPTIEKLKEDFDKHTYYGMFAAFTILPIVGGEAGLFDFGDTIVTGKVENKMFRSKSFKKALEWYLPIYEKKGFL